MKLNNRNTLVLLYLLTLLTALISKYYFGLSFFVLLVLGLSAIKFLFVAFQFMELKKAHNFWKYWMFIYVVIIVGVVSIILS